MEIKKFSFAYQHRKQLFDQLSLVFDSEKINVIIGPNGVGKSTLLDCIADVDHLRDQAVFSGFPAANEIAYQLQGVPFIGEITVEKTLQMLLKIDGSSTTKAELPAFIRQLYPQKMGELSIGQRRLVSIFGTSLLRRKLYLFDEPESGLDPEMSKLVMKQLRQLRSQGQTVILTTHQFENLDDSNYRLFLLAGGKCSFVGTISELKEFANGESYAELFHKMRLQS